MTIKNLMKLPDTAAVTALDVKDLVCCLLKKIDDLSITPEPPLPPAAGTGKK
jgi:hypothetical protein